MFSLTSVSLYPSTTLKDVPSGSVVKKICLPIQLMPVWSMIWEDPLEKEMATHSSILAKEIPWTEDPGGLWLMGSQNSWAQLSDYNNTLLLKPWVTKQLRCRLQINTVSHCGASLKSVYTFNRSEWGSGWASGKTVDTNAASGSHYQQAGCPFTILAFSL